MSNNHTTLVKGVPTPFKDICDTLQGTYQKTFKFRGWHPQCRCEMLPITITQAERKDLYKSIFEGKRDEWKPERVTGMPDGFKKWAADNADRITEASKRGTLPYFIRDNRAAVERAMKPEQMKPALFRHPISGKEIQLKIPFTTECGY